MAFRTKLDFSDNRQVKQRIETIQNLSGATSFGVTFSALPTGPDIYTSGITQTIYIINSTFSGNSGTTNYSWYDSRMSLGEPGLSAITPSNSATTQNTGEWYTANTFTTIDGNTIATTYTGVSYNINVTGMTDLGGGNYSGNVVTNTLNILSAGTIDFTGRTIWNDTSGITRTERLIVTNNPQVGYVLTCADTEGMVSWSPSSGGSSGSTVSIWIAGTGISSAVLSGSGSIASGDYTVAEGYGSLATGIGSHAEGGDGSFTGGTASGAGSHAEGTRTTASGNRSHAEGHNSTASGAQSHAEGSDTTASAVQAHAEGNNTWALAAYAHSEGKDTQALGASSHSEGELTIASGITSHAEGYNTTALGDYSHTEGSGTTAISFASHAEGYANIASGLTAHAEGNTTQALGNASHTEGSETTAIDNNGHAEGYLTISIGRESHAEGKLTNAIGAQSHAEGHTTLSIGSGSHAEGVSTIAYGDYSHAEGNSTLAGGYASHAEGQNTIASGYTSHAEGVSTLALGQFSHAEGYNTTALYDYSHSEGQNTKALYGPSHAEGQNSTASGFGAHAEGGNTLADGHYSHTEGRYTTTSDLEAHAEGSGTTAYGSQSHAEGIGSIAGTYCHAEGYFTTASGGAAHSEGGLTTSNGTYSHAGGYQSIASGLASFVHGSASTASATGTIVLGNGITGTTANVTYVEDLIIDGLTSTDPLATDINGKIVAGVSDARLKQNIQVLTNSLDIINNLRGVSFEFTEASNMGPGTRYGFIAQEVQKVVPDIVRQRAKSDGMLNLNYNEVVPILVEAVKELSQGVTTSNNTHLETQTILAEDNNIELNYSGTPQTAIGGGIRVLNARGENVGAELITDENGDWITNNDFKAKFLSIPLFTPSSTSDNTGNEGNITRDSDYLYVKTANGWKRSNLETF